MQGTLHSVHKVKLTTVVGLHSCTDFAPHLDFTFGRPRHEHASDHGMGRTNPPDLIKLRGTHGNLNDAEVGEQEASEPQTFCAEKMISGFPTRMAQRSRPSRPIGSAFVHDFGSIGEQAFFHRHAPRQRHVLTTGACSRDRDRSNDQHRQHKTKHGNGFEA